MFTKQNSAQNPPCPQCAQILTHGWAAVPPDHTPDDYGNLDEFGVVDISPFILKVNNYPPVRAFPITKSCDGVNYLFYYFSFDTEGEHFPINYMLPNNQINNVGTYRINQYGNYVNGYSVSVTPPSSSDVYTIPDFLMNYNGTMHDVFWDEDLYPWTNYVTTPVSYNPQMLQVSITGLNQLDYNETSEYIADINGGSGNYSIYWYIRNLPDGDWEQVKMADYPDNYYILNGENYYFYDDEYKYILQIPGNDVELKVEVLDNVFTSIGVDDTKQISVNPAEVTFINQIESSEDFGYLILNENKNDPIPSGNTRLLTFSNQNQNRIRTNELPFIYNWNTSGKTEKHQKWEFTPVSYTLNYLFYMQTGTPLVMKAAFSQTSSAEIKTIIDGMEASGVDLQFKDPWYYYNDSYDSWYQSDVFIPYTSPLNLLNNSGTSYGGIFLGQSGPPNWNPPYYSLNLSGFPSINISGISHKLYFWNWEGTEIGFEHINAYPTGVVFKNEIPGVDPVAKAIFKGHLLTNNQNSLSDGSQRKVVRTDNGVYHLVYESMGGIWYTYSLTTDFNGDWSDEIGINEGKNPSIDYYGNNIKIVYEQPLSEDEAAITIETYHPDGNGNYVPLGGLDQPATYPIAYYGNAKPVISFNDDITYIAYRIDNTSGIYQSFSYDNYTWYDRVIQGTNSDSKNHSIKCDQVTKTVYLAYDNSTDIEYVRCTVDGNANWYYYPENISSGSGNNINHTACISLAGNYNSPIVSWIGSHSAGIHKITGSSPDDIPPMVVVRRKGSKSWGSFFKASRNVVSVNSNSSSYGREQTVITWSEGTQPNYTSRWVRRVDTTYTDPHPLSSFGKQTQVSNGTSLSDMGGVVLSTNSTPYDLPILTTDFNQSFNSGGGTGKVSLNIDLGYGREGIVSKNGVEFLFDVGDVFVEDTTVKFIYTPDTLSFSSAEELNEVVKTEAFHLSANTSFYFTDYYYVLNREAADSLLTENDVVNFKVELVNKQTGEVAGTFDNITYNKGQLNEHNNVSYRVDCSNITPDDYYLRLVTSVQGDADYNLANFQHSEETLEKHNYNRVNFDGSKMPTTYDLSQNFPNPFNPATTINYQLPKSGYVTLKVYDILGREVATLVNEEKSLGRYSINFDGSSLASGVYIYQIRANDYVSSKKMMLIK